MNSFSMEMLTPMIPELFMAVSAMLLLIGGVFRGNTVTSFLCWSTITVFGFSLVLLLGGDWSETITFHNMFIMDSFAGLTKTFLLIGLMASLGISIHYLPKEKIQRFEYPVLVLLSGVGMMMMISSYNLLTLYMGLELQSLCLYILAAMHTRNLKSAEAGIKYFILGALASGMILFGMSLIYGATGAIDYESIKVNVDAGHEGMHMLLVGVVFLLVGFTFKISAAPFHMWAPDVYEGAPTPVTALFNIVPKIVIFALLVRLLMGPLEGITDQWQQVLWFVSALSMLVGSFAGLAQSNIKRLIAYSSIGNMGYALVGLVVASAAGITSMVVYLAIYMVMTIGLFAVLLMLSRQSVIVTKLEDFAGLSKQHPMLAYALAIILFSLAGIPPLAGFFGKLFIFQSAIAGEFYILAVLGVLTSVVSAYYYIRLIKIMFFDEIDSKFDAVQSPVNKVLAVISVIFLIGFIFEPSALYSITLDAVNSLLALS
jgi:NADH-quinone oxidoreductase subunit N